MSERESQPRTTKGPAAPPDDVSGERSKKDLDELLDEALAGTFPASDPIELAPCID